MRAEPSRYLDNIQIELLLFPWTGRQSNIPVVTAVHVKDRAITYLDTYLEFKQVGTRQEVTKLKLGKQKSTHKYNKIGPKQSNGPLENLAKAPT